MHIDLTAVYNEMKPEDVARIKLSGDFGRGSLKISCQVIFRNDPLLTLPHDADSNKQRQHLSTGVRRTFLLALIRGGEETISTIRFLLEHLRPERLFATYPDAHVSLPADMKFMNLMLGLQPHAARSS